MTESKKKQPRRGSRKNAKVAQKASAVSGQSSASLSPALTLFAALSAGVFGVVLAIRARARSKAGATAHGFSEPVHHHSAYDIEYPPAP